MTRSIRTGGHRIGRSLGKLAMRYVDMLGKYDPEGYGYYGF